ncbi:MAG: hypothetical protein ABL907_04655 [Hyphomicrobium sp.]
MPIFGDAEFRVALELLYSAGAAGTTALALLARHERRLIKARRQLILDGVSSLFLAPTLTTDGAGFPKIEGVYGGRQLMLDLIPDTMTIRRLPQLWLSVTALTSIDAADAGLAILVRPSGADFYSLTERLPVTLTPPSVLPWECLVRGESDASARTLDCIAPAAGAILADPKVKEIAVTRRGLRIIYQLAEGRRGQHLLLRQCDFDGARLEPALLARLAGGLDALALALGSSLQETPS